MVRFLHPLNLHPQISNLPSAISPSQFRNQGFVRFASSGALKMEWRRGRAPPRWLKVSGTTRTSMFLRNAEIWTWAALVPHALTSVRHLLFLLVCMFDTLLFLLLLLSVGAGGLGFERAGPRLVQREVAPGYRVALSRGEGLPLHPDRLRERDRCAHSGRGR